MIQSLASTPVRNPHLTAARPRLQAEGAPDGVSSLPGDRVSVSAAAPDAPSRASSWKSIGLAVLLAAPLVGGALSMAEAHDWSFPASTSTMCTLPENVSQPPAHGPQDPNRLQRTIFDNNVASLRRQGSFVEQFAKRGDGTYKDGTCTVTVQSGANGTLVQMHDVDHGAVVNVKGADRTVTIKQGDLEQTLRETAGERTVSSGAVTRSLYLKDGGGHHAGDFNILFSEGLR